MMTRITALALAGAILTAWSSDADAMSKPQKPEKAQASKSVATGGFPAKWAATPAERRKLYRGSRAGTASR